MAQLMQELSKDNDLPLKYTIFFVIRSVMNAQNCTFQLKTQNNKTILFREQSLLQGFAVDWKFIANDQEYIIIHVMPQFLHTFGAPLKVSNQRMLVDLLKIFSFKNSTNVWNIIVKQTNEIVLQYMSKIQQLLKSFPAYLNFLKKEVRVILQRLLLVLQPYSFQTLPIYQSESKYLQSPSSTIEDIFSGLMMLETRKKIRESLQQSNQKSSNFPAKNIQMRRQQVFKIMRCHREKAFNYVAETLKISGGKSLFIQSISQQKLKRNELSFKIWQSSSKLKSKSDYKNVFGVKILNQITEKDKKKAEGTHCQVIMGRFQIVIMASLNMLTNIAFQSINGAQSLRYQKQLELVKKKCKDRQKEPSLNSFYNQLDFIEYIKDRNCKYVSTYYWQMEKKKVEMEHIIMEFYPHTLLSAQQSKMSLQEALTILLYIVQALAWLADNHVCHRDIKPENIMLNSERIPKIVDFGSCCPSFRGGTKQTFTVKDQRLLATPGYTKKYKDLPQELKVKYTKKSYQEHILYDAYSYGKMMQQILSDYTCNSLNLGNDFLQYLYKRCQEVVPQDRPTYEQIGFVLCGILKHLQQHYQSF